jgi:hypothetical protein
MPVFPYSRLISRWSLSLNFEEHLVVVRKPPSDLGFRLAVVGKVIRPEAPDEEKRKTRFVWTGIITGDHVYTKSRTPPYRMLSVAN